MIYGSGYMAIKKQLLKIDCSPNVSADMNVKK